MSHVPSQIFPLTKQGISLITFVSVLKTVEIYAGPFMIKG